MDVGVSQASGPLEPTAEQSNRTQVAHRVLLVEDHADNRDMLREFLEWTGFEVLLAESGEEALEAAASGHPELVLMDVTLPGIDGFEATRRLRRLEGCSSLPVVALTGHTRREAVAACGEAGCDAYLTKPVQPDELVSIIRQLLKSRAIP